METKELKLKAPIQFGSDKIESLTFREAKAKDFRDMPITPKIGDLLNVAAKLSGQPPSVIDLLSPGDMTEVLTLMGEFMGPGPATGESASAP
jgi:hypothetical protein